MPRRKKSKPAPNRKATKAKKRKSAKAPPLSIAPPVQMVPASEVFREAMRVAAQTSTDQKLDRIALALHGISEFIVEAAQDRALTASEKRRKSLPPSRRGVLNRAIHKLGKSLGK